MSEETEKKMRGVSKNAKTCNLKDMKIIQMPLEAMQ